MSTQQFLEQNQGTLNSLVCRSTGSYHWSSTARHQDQQILLPCGLPAPEGDMGTTRYATMDLPRLARPEGCCDMTVYLCEDYGLG